MKSFVREKRTHAGAYVEVDLFTRTLEQEAACKKNRGRRTKLTRPSQSKLNDKNSKRYAKLLIYSNFVKNDYYLTLTYSNEHLPKTPAEAKKHQDNTIRKWKRLYKKNGKELKYIWFTSYQFDKESGYVKRIHHHVLVNRLGSRDEVEACWTTGRGKKKEELGRTRAELIQLSKSNGIHDLAAYLTNQEKWEGGRWKKGEKKWSCSQNLKRPYETKNDHKWSQKKLNSMATNINLGEEMILMRFPDHQVIGEIKTSYYEDSGWHIHVELISRGRDPS